MMYSDELRSRLAPSRERTTIRDLAARIGVSQTALFRFLRGGTVQSDTIDAIEAFVRQAERRTR